MRAEPLAARVEVQSAPREEPSAAPPQEDRIERIERQLAELRAEVRALRDELGA